MKVIKYNIIILFIYSSLIYSNNIKHSNYIVEKGIKINNQDLLLFDSFAKLKKILKLNSFIKNIDENTNFVSYDFKVKNKNQYISFVVYKKNKIISILFQTNALKSSFQKLQFQEINSIDSIATIKNIKLYDSINKVKQVYGQPNSVNNKLNNKKIRFYYSYQSRNINIENYRLNDVCLSIDFYEDKVVSILIHLILK